MTQHINLPNCIVAQSGGPTVAINASLVGVICASIGHYGTVYGSNQWYSRYSEPALLKSYRAGGFPAKIHYSGLQLHRPCIWARAATN